MVKPILSARITSVSRASETQLAIQYEIRNWGPTAANFVSVFCQTAAAASTGGPGSGWGTTELGRPSVTATLVVEAGQTLALSTSVDSAAAADPATSTETATAVVVSVSDALLDPFGRRARQDVFRRTVDAGNLIGGVDPPPILQTGWRLRGNWTALDWSQDNAVDERRFIWHHALDPGAGQRRRGIRGTDAPDDFLLQLETPLVSLRFGEDTVCQFEYLARAPDDGTRTHTPGLASVDGRFPELSPPEASQPVELSATGATNVWTQHRIELFVPTEAARVFAGLYTDASAGDYLFDGLSVSQRHRSMALAWVPSLALTD
ncbi:hypothetical protein [Geodermatophilus sp. SYSU D00867]